MYNNNLGQNKIFKMLICDIDEERKTMKVTT